MANDLYDRLMQNLTAAKDRDENYKTAKADLWRQVSSEKDRYFEMFFNNWFNNNWAKTRSRRYKPRKKLTPEGLRAQRKEDTNLRGIALMNTFLSDGETRLKDATGAQVRQELGWFQVIAKHVKPNEIVGRKLTAEQLYNLKVQTSDITKPPRNRPDNRDEARP